MRQEDKIIGVLEVVNKKTLPWTEDDHDHLMVLVSQASVAIDRVQMVTALKKANQELSELDKLKSDFIASFKGATLFFEFFNLDDIPSFYLVLFAPCFDNCVFHI